MKIICEGEVIIQPLHCQHTYKPTVFLCNHTHIVVEGVGRLMGELTKETSHHPPSLSPSTGLEAHQRPLLPGVVTTEGHLLPAHHSIGLIVLLFIYFTIDLSAEADMALIHSDWLSWCDGWSKASKQTQCKTSVTCVCVCACVSVKLCLCTDLQHCLTACV